MAGRILIVEDNDDLRQMFDNALTMAGFSVSQAADGMQALRRIDSDAPDLVVLDLRLPFFSGVEIRKDLADNVFTRAIPVIVVSGTPEDLGPIPVDCALKKPVEPAMLVETVRRCLAVHGKM